MRHSVQVQIKLTDSAEAVAQAVARGAALATKRSERYDDPESQVRDSMFLCSAQEITEQVGRWVEAGVDHFILMTPRPFDRRMIERFAAEVAPAFA